MSKREILAAGGSVRNRQPLTQRGDLADLRPVLPVRGLFADVDTHKRLMTLIERLFTQKINADRDQVVDLPLTDTELSILDIIAKGLHTSSAALMREALYDVAGKYHHKYRGINDE